MKFVFFRILFVFLIFFGFSFTYSQENQKLSNGVLKVGETKIPIKIFSTSSFEDLGNFSPSPNQNTLVYLPEDLGNFLQTSEYKNYFLQKGYFLFDKNFNENPEEIKFLYYSKNYDKKLFSTYQKKLETDFLIWDPNKGIGIGGFTLHFYSLMFVFAFGFGLFFMKKMFKKDEVSEKFLEPLVVWTIVGTILGARLGHVIFYQPELFKQDFLSVFLPIKTKPTIEFSGFQGLASHGATIGLIFTTLYYSLKIIKKNPFWVYDRLGIVVALGGCFVRIGNFINSEIIGKSAPENHFFAVLFPQMSGEYGATIPRYPTQLFEAFGYLMLFILLWILYHKTNKKYQQGWLFGVFFVLLWSIRFFVEYFKEPQGDEFISFLGLNTGQILSIPFIMAGFFIIYWSKNYKIHKE